MARPEPASNKDAESAAAGLRPNPSQGCSDDRDRGVTTVEVLLTRDGTTLHTPAAEVCAHVHDQATPHVEDRDSDGVLYWHRTV